MTTSFPSILIDPYILHLESHLGSFDEFIEKITAWSELTAREDIELLFSEQCMEGMYYDGCFPEPHKVRTFYRQKCDDIHIDEKTFCEIVSMVIQSTPSFERKSGHKSAEFEDRSSSITPDILSRLKTNTKGRFEKCLHCFSAWIQSSKSNVAIGSYSCDQLTSFDGYLNIKSIVNKIETYDTSQSFDYNYPLELDSEHPVYNCFDEILGNIDIIEVWVKARNENAVRDCIEKQISMLAKNGLTGSKKKYQIGTELVNSLKRWGFDSRDDWARNFIESCARIVLGLPKNEVKDFDKKDATGKRIHVVRIADGAKGYRTHLTKGSEGFRLMFWELPDSSVEFANVGDKNELEIF